ncbi:LOW QUALITY PROTEIN: F-box only protein 10 [Ara ararauna]
MPTLPRQPLTPGVLSRATAWELAHDSSRELPVELRQLIACLCLPDLGCCSLVYRVWYELVLSRQNRWQLCLGCLVHRHPSWPNQPGVEPQPWREAFKQHYLASKTWTKTMQDMQSSNCVSLFQRKEREMLCVIIEAEFSSLQATLGTTSPYNHLVLLPVVHEEQNKVLLKVPVEVVGQGKLGDLALLATIDQHCPTACFCCVVFMLSFFSLVLYKVRLITAESWGWRGHQRIPEDSRGFPRPPEFPGCLESTIRGSLILQTSSGNVQFNSCNFESGQLQIHAPEMCQVKFCTFNQSSIYLHSMALCILESCEFTSKQSSCLSAVGAQALLGSAQKDIGFRDNLQAAKEEKSPALDPDCSDSDLNSDDVEDAQAAYKLPYQAHSLSHTIANVMESRLQSNRLHTLQRDLKLKSLQQDKKAQFLANSLQCCCIIQCLFTVGKGGLFIYSQGQAKLEGSIFRDLTYAVCFSSSLQVIVLRNDIHHCKASGIFLRLSAEGLIADSHIHSNCEAGVDIRKEANPLVLCNKIHSGLHSGIVIIGNRKGIIHSNQIYGNKEAGIYIWYNGNPAVNGNHIFQGLAAGIAVNENRRDQITGNVICENQWGGADISGGGDPVLKNNLISSCSDSVVVGEHGKSLIEGNIIYGNKGCGVMMSSSLPHLISYQISHNSIYGVAVFCHKDAAAGSHIKSSEVLHVIASVIHANHDGRLLVQSSQLICVPSSSISCNSRRGMLVEPECQVEIHVNDIYENCSHGIVSREEGIIIENDIIDNHQRGLQLLQAADMKGVGLILQETKNRIQSFWNYGIALFDKARVVVQENLIFQGRSKKSILQPISNAEDCIIQNNMLLTFKKRSVTNADSKDGAPQYEG